MQLDEASDLGDDEAEYSVPDELSLPELFNPLTVETREQHDERAEQVFEGLLDLVEAESAETEDIAELAPPEFMAELTAPEAAEVAGESAPEVYEPTPIVAAPEPFTEQEWALVIDVVEVGVPGDFADDVLVFRGVVRGARGNSPEALEKLLRRAIIEVFEDWPV